MTVQRTHRTAFDQDWADWRRQHEAVLVDQHGFLAITSLNWLTTDPQRFPDAPGAWRADVRGVAVDLGEEDELIVGGARATGRYDFGTIPERGGISAVSGEAVIEVAKRGGHDILRPRHPGNPLRVSFAGVPVYAPDPRWALPGRYVAFPAPQPTTVGSVVEGLQHVYAAPGFIQFEFGGQPHRLTAFSGRSPGSLSILFTDATSGVTTYAACRSLQVDAPDEQGMVTVDFNRAVNLPCAFTDFATCPLPPAENRLPFAVESGEKIPYERA
jgi:uncharacterized protein